MCTHQTTDLQITWYKIDRAEGIINKPNVIIEELNISLSAIVRATRQKL